MPVTPLISPVTWLRKPPWRQNTAIRRMVSPSSATGTRSGPRQIRLGSTVARLNSNTARYCGRALGPGVVVKLVGCRNVGLSFNMATRRVSSSA